jgi:hypothetical protein
MDDWGMDDGMMSALGLEPASSSEAQDGGVCAGEFGAVSSSASSRVNRDPAAMARPEPGINRTGFIDHSDGANLRVAPAEAGGDLAQGTALPPATRVFVSGRHPQAAQWWYVTAFLEQGMARGYVQDLRVTVELPEPTAKLHQVVSGDTAERLAVQEYSAAVRDGHDLRYYENVLLKVNRDGGRAGIVGAYQDPGLLGGGSNNIQLVAGHRIWLVSPAFARSLEGVVPDGSLTNGTYAKVKRFAGHIEDILRSVTESPAHLGAVAGEYAQAIRDHLPEIIGIVAGFLMAEALSALLAASPTGVGQLAAVVIQLGLAAFGAVGIAAAGLEALEHASQWLTLAWTAQGRDAQISAASREFLKMLVSIAMAALATLGVKANYGKALQIAGSMPSGALPALAIAGGGELGGGAGVAVAAELPQPYGPFATAGGMMAKQHGEGGGSPEPLSEAAKGKARTEMENLNEQLKNPDLSGKQKKALRARKKELREQLGLSAAEEGGWEPPPPEKYKARASGLSGKEAATDVPSWIENWPDARPGIHESGEVFATRMMNKRYGVGGWERTGAQKSEFSKLQKFGDRAFE